MAPVDRHEHRQQRVRGAGPSSVQATFGFNFGAAATKQSSLPPQPVAPTPRDSNGPTPQPRSSSAPRSSARKRNSTPKDRTVTPQLRKRKRTSQHAQNNRDEKDVDELSPDHHGQLASAESSRRVTGHVSAIREDGDDMADELSVLDEGSSSVKKRRDLGTEEATTGTVIASSPQNRTPKNIVKRSRSAEGPPITPGLQSGGRLRASSASRFAHDFTTPSAVQVNEDSEDELTSPPINASTPRIVKEQRPQPTPREDGDLDIDELSPPTQASVAQQAPVIPQEQQVDADNDTEAIAGQPQQNGSVQVVEESRGSSVSQPAKRGRPKRVIEETGEQQAKNQAIAPAPATVPAPAKRGRPRRIVQDEEDEVQFTPVVSKPIRPGQKVAQKQDKAEREDEPDELSPEMDRQKQVAMQSNQRKRKAIAPSAEESANEDSHSEPEESIPDPSPPRVRKQKSPKQAPQTKSSSDNVPRKRSKSSGPKQAISVMRLKGSTIRGITIADTTRTILEENINRRLQKLAEKMRNTQDSARRKNLRGAINVSIAFKESLNEKLLDLQDANDVLTSNLRKTKMFKNRNGQLRKEILTLQNSRQDVALELDEVQVEFEMEKERAMKRQKLSDDMFDIQAAIETGREKARQERRQGEGPDLPLSMLLEDVGRNVGSVGGGLLANVKGFNSALEKAVGWLEGRA